MMVSYFSMYIFCINWILFQLLNIEKGLSKKYDSLSSDFKSLSQKQNGKIR